MNPSRTPRHSVLALTACCLLTLALPASAQTVSKTVADFPNYQARATWTIEKTADVGAEVTLQCEQELPVEYSVTVEKTGLTWETDIAGNVTITNTTGGPLTLTALVDNLTATGNGALSASFAVACGLPRVLAGGESIVCPYAGRVHEPDLVNHFDRNEAVATFTGVGDVSSGLVPFFSIANSQTRDRCIVVTDPADPSSPRTFCFSSTPSLPPGAIDVGINVPYTYTYADVLGPYTTSGPHTVTNTATFVGLDEGSGGAGTGSASFEITVNVDCGGGGCSLTQGYWKTHSTYGPAAHPNPTWNHPDIGGPDAPFGYGTNKTWYEMFHTPPSQGNAYVSLAHQYMAARLNLLAGAPDIIAAQIADAEDFFANQLACFQNPRGCPREIKQAMSQLAGELASYNEGTMPGTSHCDGDVGGGNALTGDATDFVLATPSPNPSPGLTTVRFEVPAASALAVVVFDALGREVARLAEGEFEAGTHEVVWEADGLPSGTYFVRMTAGAFRTVRPLVLAR